MMKKRYIVFIIGLIIIICIFIANIFFNIHNKSKNLEDSSEQNKIEETENQNEDDILQKKIENIKGDLGYNNTNTNMYEIKQEYDGREVITIKPNLKYKVAMAGAIKKEKPEFSEIDSLLEQLPKQSGIWITKSSRDNFLKILKEVNLNNYTIDDKGYLIQNQSNNMTDIDKKLKKIINGNNLYSIDINKTTYLLDDVTGKIEEYPFEDIDPETPFELFQSENASLYVITENTNKKLDYNYIIEEVLNSINNY